MKALLLALSTLLLVCLLGSVRAEDLTTIPDGAYNCHKISSGSLIGLATLEIRGKTYRFSEEDQYAPYTVDAAGHITWSAGISFLPAGWKVTSSEYKGAVKGFPTIHIRYVSGSGNHEVIDCVRE